MQAAPGGDCRAACPTQSTKRGRTDRQKGGTPDGQSGEESRLRLWRGRRAEPASVWLHLFCNAGRIRLCAEPAQADVRGVQLGCAASGESQRDSDGLLLCARRDSAVRRGGGGRAPFGAAGLCSADPRALEAHPAARRVCRRGALLPRGGTPGGASADVYGVSPVGVCVSRAAWAAAGGAAGAASA